MSRNSEHAPSLSFILPERKSLGERKFISGTPVLNFRKHTAIEPDDARITGTTRSLYRRLLALNLRKPVVSQREVEEVYMPPLTA